MQKDLVLEVEEREREKDLNEVRSKRKAIAVLLAAESEDLPKSVVDKVTTRTETPMSTAPVPRPRRGWTKIIRDILTEHPDTTLFDILALARSKKMVPDGVTDEEFNERIKFALRDLTAKGFTTIHKVDKKTPATYSLNHYKLSAK